ncbi:NAD(P)-binding domain-containing protein [Puia sp. P3]|uniref:NAD(P)-binding domain-containing protein n=1 Tax=Puia sp. P3 TaxID=3423952 RepID=UPI003D66698D
MRFGVIGSGSWATALAKVLTDNKNTVNWWVRNEDVIRHIRARHHNPQYLPSVYFDTNLLALSDSVGEVVAASDCLVVAVPSAYTAATLETLDRKALEGQAGPVGHKRDTARAKPAAQRLSRPRICL